MSGKEPIKVKLSTVILSFIIFALIIFIAFIYFYFTNVEETKQNNESNKIVDTNSQLSETENTTIETSKIETLNTSSELVKKVYDYIPVINVMKYEPYNAYQTGKVTINDLDTEYILGCAFTKLSLSDKDKDYIYPGDDGWYRFDANLLQQKVKEMYNQNVENKSFEYSGGAQGCSYSEGKYTHSSGGYVSQNLISIREIEKSYMDGEKLIIEDKYIALKSDDINQTNELFSSSNSTKGIKKIDIDLIEKTHEMISKEIKENYADEMTRYRHTFKKNVDGLYYWYSTEPIQ